MAWATGGSREVRHIVKTEATQYEPTASWEGLDANLDKEGVALVASLVQELSDGGKMVAVAAHSPELAALSRSSVVLDTTAFVG